MIGTFAAGEDRWRGRYTGRLVFLVFSLALFAVVFGGCGGENSEEGGEEGEAPAQTTEEAAGGEARDTVPQASPEEEGAAEETLQAEDSPEPEEPAADGRVEKPEAVKGLYVPGSAASGAQFEGLLELAEGSEANALVVDVKEAGNTTYPSEVPLASRIGATTQDIPDLERFVESLHSRGLYAIARLSVFQDDILPRSRPDLAVLNSATGGPWVTYNGAAWSDPYDREVWEYNVAIAREAAEAGFDEIQFDYVRFPSDGPMSRLSYGEETYPTQEATIAGFLEYAQEELDPTGAEVSADVFGLVGINDDVGVGQVVSQMVPHLDVLSPMVYPSHYPPGAYGYQNPDVYPREIVELAMADFKRKAEEVNPEIEIRPWLQDFDYGSPYGPAEVRAQIEATEGSGIEGWLLWNAAADYTEGVL